MDTVPAARGHSSYLLIAAGWAFAEAICFFLVPDIYLTRIVLVRGLSSALRASLAAALAAVAGGALIYTLAASGSSERLTLFYTHIPGINSGLISRANAELDAHMVTTVLIGGIQGIPYKVFVLRAGERHTDASVFLASSALARLLRFTATVLAAWVAERGLRRFLTPAGLLRTHLAFWSLFYLGYFSLTSP